MVTEKIQWHSFLPAIPLSKKQGVPNPLFYVKPYWTCPSLQVREDQPVFQSDQQWLCLSLLCSSDKNIWGLIFYYQTQDAHDATAIRALRLT